jgi:hypothetical protein
MLVSSLMALMHVSAVTLIVIRNLTSLTVAALEATVLDTRVPLAGVASLAGILAGAVMYGLHDITFSAVGYAWLTANLVTTSAYQVLVKRVISSEGARDIGPLGYSYINNALSLPMLVVVAAVAGEPARMLGAGVLSSADGLVRASLLAASGVLGFCLSVTAFKLNTLISATSMMVANNVNKVRVFERGGVRGEMGGVRGCPNHGYELVYIAKASHGVCATTTTFDPTHTTHTTRQFFTCQFFVILLSEIFIQRTLDAVASAGTVVVLVFGWTYAQARK